MDRYINEDLLQTISDELHARHGSPVGVEMDITSARSIEEFTHAYNEYLDQLVEKIEDAGPSEVVAALERMGVVALSRFEF